MCDIRQKMNIKLKISSSMCFYLPKKTCNAKTQLKDKVANWPFVIFHLARYLLAKLILIWLKTRDFKLQNAF